VRRPGEVLQEFLSKLGITQTQFATHVENDPKVVNRIINGRSGITAEMSLKLSAALGTTPEYWLDLQREVDLSEAKRKLKKLPARISAENLSLVDREPTANVHTDGNQTETGQKVERRK
jgi:addiction module HigA family antidote